MIEECANQESDTQNSHCVVSARINLHPELVDKVGAILRPKDTENTNNTCSSDAKNMSVGSASELPFFVARGRFSLARHCNFVDFTAKASGALKMGQVELVVVVHLSRQMTEEAMQKFFPFVTIEWKKKSYDENSLCNSAIKHRELSYNF